LFINPDQPTANLALALFVLGFFTDNAHDTFAPDNFAIAAQPLY